MDTTRSEGLYEAAIGLMPGGVNSPVRAFRAVGGTPLFIERGSGAYVWDVDGNRFLDCMGSWGPLLFGHGHPRIVEAIQRQLARGTTFGAPTALEVEMAAEVQRAVPSIEKLRLVSSGTEAVMSAVRVARGFTGRTKVVKFEGCYHGHADSLLSRAGSGVATLGLPDSAGVPPPMAADTITLPFNDRRAVEALYAEAGDTIACVLVEPVAGNMGCVPPADGFLQDLRHLTRRHGSVLVFDEVITGFRLARGGAQEHYGVVPDMTTLGKILGGGLPMGAYGGAREIMDVVAPVGPVYQAGTLSGNPLAVAAGLETLRLIAEEPRLYARLEERGRRAADGLRRAADAQGVVATVNQEGSMLTLFFSAGPVTDYASAKTSDTTRFAAFHRAMLQRGVYLPPSQFEAAFISDAMADADIDHLLDAASDALRELA